MFLKKQTFFFFSYLEGYDDREVGQTKANPYVTLVS